MTNKPSQPAPQTETWLADFKVTREGEYVTQTELTALLQRVTAAPKAVACVENLLACCQEALVALSDLEIDRGTVPAQVACTGLARTLAIAIGTATGHMPQWVIEHS